MGLKRSILAKSSFPILMPTIPTQMTFQRTLGFYYQPELYLLDANGNVLKKFIGFTSQEDLTAEFAKYIQ